MRPKVAFLDPTLTYSVSKYQTACGSSDILNHIMEVYFTMENDLYMLDTVMEGLMKTVIRYAPIAMEDPENYEARANLLWTSSWAINGFIDGGKQHAWSCHPIEHELSAFYDITHGLGLAIVAPRWMEYTLSEKTVSRFYQFGVNVFGIDASLPQMEVAKQSIEKVKEFLFTKLGLKSTLSEIGIDDTHFKVMAKKAVKLGYLAYGFVPLNEEDVEKILRMCL
ncbi:MAG: iron-containing alcohol dehydrogenase, partial [Clostridiales bacterium]|nr:iron-containing alcohol dehydrogenase [Clostridiales bacterium]